VDWENQRQINAIIEDETMIELHYSRTFALIERMKIEKVLESGPEDEQGGESLYRI
jgi:hypothetical protein